MTIRRKAWRSFFVVSVICLFFSACGGGVSAPKTPDGSEITLFLLTDTGVTEKMKEPEQADRNQVADQMSAVLKRLFQEGGYRTESVPAPDAFKPEARKLMVVLTVDETRSEDVYTQIATRLGTGVTHIRGTIEVFKDNHTLPVSRYTESIVSSRDWTVAADELTKKLAKAASDRINELY